MAEIRTPKWFSKYLKFSSKPLLTIIFIAFITGLTSFGLPSPPPLIQDILEKFADIKWIMLWLLIYQGGSEQNLQIASGVTLIIYIVYNHPYFQQKLQDLHKNNKFA